MMDSGDYYSEWSNHWYTQGTQIGCPEASGKNCHQCCETPMEPTLKSLNQLTYLSQGMEVPSEIQNHANPWFAPGHAPVANSCGILGGWKYSSTRDYVAGPDDAYYNFINMLGQPTNNQPPPDGMSTPAGTSGTDVLQSDLNQRKLAQGANYRTNDNPIWKAGTPQEVSYSLVANHGGGVQFRLCELGHLWDGTMNEDCFEALDFVGSTAWFNPYGAHNNTDNIPFAPVRVNDANTDGVLPAGSTWTQIPLPACAGPLGGISGHTFGARDSNWECDTPQFHNEISDAGYFGYGDAGANSDAMWDGDVGDFVIPFEIIDTVQVPEGLEGDYVVSWRWDSEQTAQVWTQCSIVTIEAAAKSKYKGKKAKSGKAGYKSGEAIVTIEA